MNSALVDETEEDNGDLRREMIRPALQGQAHKAPGEVVSLFIEPQQHVRVISNNPTGSPTVTSPRLTIFNLLLAQAKGEIQVSRKMPHKPRTVLTSELQLAMF